MSSAKDRFKEAITIIDKGLSGEVIDHCGEYYNVGRRVFLRPTPNRDKIFSMVQ